MAPQWLWFVFVAFVLAALFVDFVVLRKQGAHDVTVPEAIRWSAIWVALSFAFNGLLWWAFAQEQGTAVANTKALEFLTGYLIEKSLAVDNIFVFLMIFTYFAVPSAYQKRVLMIGIIGAIVLRTVMILAAMAGTSSQRRASTHLGDQGQVHDQRWVVGAGLDWQTLGRVDARLSARDRSNPFVLGRNPAASLQDQQTLIASQSHDLQLTYTGRWGGWPVSMGWQQSKSDYERLGPGQAVVDSTRSLKGQTRQRAWWADTTWALSPQWSLSSGVRLDRWTHQSQATAYTRQCQVQWVEFEGELFPVNSDCVDAFRNQKQSREQWFNRGGEVALSWQPEPGWKLYAQASQHFRNPNVDELFKAADDLRPQQGRTGELGISRSMGAAWAWSATAFDIRTEHEIGYSLDPVSSEQVNRNQTQPTRRQGLELDGRWQALPAWRLQAQAGWVRPRFEGTGQVISLVARFQASVQSQVRTSAQSWWSVSLRHVGARDDGNTSPATPFGRLPAYQVVDTSWRWQWGDFQATWGVNNLLDKAYSTLAFSNTVYPMPERHAYVAVKWQLK
jgi:outer membrane receptor protein involved in Fe transport